MKTDVTIIGGGPGGSVCALFLLAAGIRPTIIESETFPRFHIGESLTGECGNTLRALGLEDAMSQGQHPVKRGTTVYGAGGKYPFWVPVMGRAADGTLFGTTTWQVRRSTFDAMLLEEAVRRGANLVRGRAMRPLRAEDGAVRGVLVRTADGKVEEIESRVLVDASGQQTFLANHGVTSKKKLGKYDKQVAIFSHVRRAVHNDGDARGNTDIFYQEWLHWAWFIPVDEETVSVGVVVPGSYFRARQESTEEFYLRELRELNPRLSERVSEIDLVEEVRAMANYSYSTREYAGPGYLCIGDAHRFIDPIFSFGVYLSINEGRFAAQHVARYLEGIACDGRNPFAAYQQRCEQGMDVVHELIDAFWNEPLGFALVVHKNYRDDLIDLFAGRLYEDTPSPGLLALRKINASRG